MCLVTFQKKPFITKKDLKTWKIIKNENGNLKSGFHHQNPFYYELNKLYQTPIKTAASFDGKYNLSKFDDLEDVYFEELKIKFGSGYFNKFIISYGEGFHSLTKIRALNFKFSNNWIQRYIIVECIIPKGSEYYRSGNGLLISNAIILEKVLNVENDLKDLKKFLPENFFK